MDADFIIIGGGIVGLSTARALQARFPGRSVRVLEKEPQLATHQTGHNSGVIHAGVYYAPGSLKARLCREGNAATYRFCEEEGIPVERCGKLLVATDERELGWMDGLHDRGRQNGIAVERWSAEKLQEAEPNIRGLGAVWVRDTGIVDYGLVARRLADRVVEAGGTVTTGAPVTGIQEDNAGVTVMTPGGSLQCGRLVVCGGLMADRLVRMQGLEADFRILPFRGEYYRLPAERAGYIRHLIYPIPDPALPFLGVHLTRMIDGSITVGPNAVLSGKREGYRKRDIHLGDIAGMLAYPGFWRLTTRYLGNGVGELLDSFCKRRYLKRVQKYAPGLGVEDLLPHPAGVRAQAVNARGELLHDFLFKQTPRTLHVCNAPSPAATSAMPIGRYIAEQIPA